MRVEQLEQPRHGATYCDHITLVEVVPEFEEAVNSIRETTLAHFTHILGQVVGNQTVAIGKKLRSHLRNIPAWDIGMKAVKEGGIDHRFWERSQQVAGFD